MNARIARLNHLSGLRRTTGSERLPTGSFTWIESTFTGLSALTPTLPFGEPPRSG